MKRHRTTPAEEELRRQLRQLSGACAECGRGAPRSLAGEIGIGYSTLNRFITGSRPVGPEQEQRIRWWVEVAQAQEHERAAVIARDARDQAALD